MILIGNTCTHNTMVQKYEITEEEDRPFPQANVLGEASVVAQDVPTLMRLNDQKHSHDIDNFKNTTGKHILYACLGAMALAATADAIFHIESPLLTSAFEVAKIVANIILGYFFGSKSK